ncbi:uncharacterized protein LOC8268850 [Ricinus communis]|uniref:OVATE domain-containing protein n=1 Tax=Ricinus communis TaxID=3988 RepID=B9RKR1_RICCO|nr:uncharacterized protein LOC8268850 [Ricinus communis]EEF48259.1 conserved hypothetical protein [Ricinus communis]|eukprot:XP_002514305.1 uncharacterized protein LOC8268850 [Ricinus communis]
MLLRNSISNTKKFFQRTLQNFKSFFSTDPYQRIPKTSPYNNHYPNHSTTPLGTDMNIVQTSFNNNKDLDKFYNDFSDRWDTDNSIKGKAMKRRNKKLMRPPSPEAKQEKDSINGSFMKLSKANADHQIQRREDYSYKNGKVKGFNRFQESKRDEERSFLVAQKLKELEMMDMSNVDHVLDIEEVLHYYSRLTCPAYLEIVDKFFMDMYAEFFGPPSTPRSVNSRPLRLHS